MTTAFESDSASFITGSLDSLTEKQKRIYAYLAEHAESKTYFKSREIAEALGLSAKEVGVNMTNVKDADGPIEIEPWGYSSSTTWMVTRDQTQ